MNRGLKPALCSAPAHVVLGSHTCVPSSPGPAGLGAPACCLCLVSQTHRQAPMSSLGAESRENLSRARAALTTACRTPLPPSAGSLQEQLSVPAPRGLPGGTHVRLEPQAGVLGARMAAPRCWHTLLPQTRQVAGAQRRQVALTVHYIRDHISQCTSCYYRRRCRALLLKPCLPLPPRFTRFSSVLLSAPALRGACDVGEGQQGRQGAFAWGCSCGGCVPCRQVNQCLSMPAAALAGCQECAHSSSTRTAAAHTHTAAALARSGSAP